MHNFLDYKDHFKKNFTLAYPVMLSQLGHMMVGVADSMMIGHLGAVPLGAASLANGIYVIILTFGIGISYAITPMVALADGAGEIKRSVTILNHGTIINFLFGLILTLIVIASSPVLRFLNQPPDVVELAIPYFNIITVSLIPFMIFQSFKQFAEGLSDTRPAMIIIISANIINIILNYLLIYGKAGFPAFGLNGAGIATIISRLIMAVAIVYYIVKASAYKQYLKHLNFKIWHKRIYREVIRIGLPIGFQYVFEVGAFSMAVVLMGWLGEIELAAHQIAINLASVTYMMASGIAAAATIRIGNQLGQKNKINLRNAGFTSFIMGIAFMTFAAVFFIIGRYFLPGLYINNPDVIQLASQLLIIAAFFQVSDGIQVVGLGALRGMADVKIPTFITLIAYWIIGLPVGYILAFEFNFGPQGIWYGLLTGLTIAALLLSLRFNSISQRIL